MKYFLIVLSVLLLLFGINMMISSVLPSIEYGESIEVPRLVSLLSGSFVIYGAYVVWKSNFE